MCCNKDPAQPKLKQNRTERLEDAYETIRGIYEMNPVLIILQPTDASVKASTKATFSVKVLTEETVSYQWQYKSTAEGASWTNSGAQSGTSATLNFTASASFNGYKYRCKITWGSNVLITNEVTLTVGS